MPNSDSHWKVVYVASRFEKKVSEGLTRRGIEQYLPLVTRIRMWSDRKKKVEVPLFNGYVFVRPAESRRDEVLQIPGVVKYIRHNQNDAIVRSSEIELIKLLIDTGYNIENSNGYLKQGDKVRIEQGPLKGIEAEILNMPQGQSYALICFDTISQTIKVTLPTGILTKV